MGFGGAGQTTAGAADPEAAADADADAEAGADAAAVALAMDATGEGAAEGPQPTTASTAPTTRPRRGVARSRIGFPSRTTPSLPSHLIDPGKPGRVRYAHQP